MQVEHKEEIKNQSLINFLGELDKLWWMDSNLKIAEKNTEIE